MTPEHLHLALNHLPFLGAGFALIPLIMGWITRQRTTVIAGLMVAALAGWATPLVMSTGEAAYERYEEGPVKPYLDAEAEAFLEIHEHRAHDWSKVMYASAVISTLGLVVLLRKPDLTRVMAAVAALFCLLSLVSGLWISASGGPIRRPDFRGEKPPATTSSAENDNGHE